MEGTQRTFERLTLNERIQHIVLVVSFMLLVITGAPLFLYKWAFFHTIMPTEMFFHIRSTLHRAAAVMLIVLVLYHMGYILFTRRGRSELKEFLPRIKDLRDFFHLIKYNLGFAKEGPRFGRYNIIHKFEYWAVGWGSCMMIVTGFILWFEVQAMIWLPKWILDVTRVIHGYEAILAFLTIIIWHFYNVHFNPDVFPMSKLWLNGKLTEEEMKKYHPLEYEELMEREKKKY